MFDGEDALGSAQGLDDCREAPHVAEGACAGDDDAFPDDFNFLLVDCSMTPRPPPSPNVAELSAPTTTPSLQRIPTMAVTPVASPIHVSAAYPVLTRSKAVKAWKSTSH
jgi:hypothetical protein